MSLALLIYKYLYTVANLGTQAGLVFFCHCKAIFSKPGRPSGSMETFMVTLFSSGTGARDARFVSLFVC